MPRFLLAFLLVLLGSFALADGRAACRFELPLGVTCYGEEVLFNVGPLEVVGGGEIRLPHDQAPQFVPYVGLGYYEPEWFVILESRWPLEFITSPWLGWKFAITAGVRWTTEEPP